MYDIKTAYERGEGVLRLAPVFVPRRFSRPGRRLKLHPDDYFALGTRRGAIKERWFSSVAAAMNGEYAPEDEGMSYVAPTNNKEDRFLFRDAVAELTDRLIGAELFGKYGTWPMYAKFFDYEAPLFHHLHLPFEKAALVGRLGKPEAYYYPPQLNNHPGQFPVTYFGFSPEVTPEQVKERLRMYETGDNRVTELSRAYRIELGTGWYTPAGVLHAPGSYLTYEPQWNSDVNSVYENVTAGEAFPVSFLNENCPPDKADDIEFIFSLLDWEKNVDPDYKKKYFRPPLPCRSPDGSEEKWITYANEYFGAKELTVLPGQTVTVADPAAYGVIFVQGRGRFGAWACETHTLLRYGQLSNDEFFVSEPAAKSGIKITNESDLEPLVLLKHFGPNHPEMPKDA